MRDNNNIIIYIMKVAVNCHSDPKEGEPQKG
jgi:hypothetical protein